MSTRISAANAVRSHSASKTPTDSMTRTASAEPSWIESVRTTTSSAAKAASRRAELAALPDSLIARV